MDISPLEELTEKVLESDAYLFTVKPAAAEDYRVFTNDEFLAEKRFIGENPAPGTTISYYLKSAPEGDVKLAIFDKSGTLIRELTATKEKGINRVQWDLRGKPPVQPARAAGGGRGGRGGGEATAGAIPAATEPAAGGGGRGGSTVGALVDPGEYVAKLTAGGKELSTPVLVEADPAVTITNEDRATRRSIITAVLELQGKTQRESTRADALDTQLSALAKTDAPSPIKKALTDAAKEAAAQKTELARINRSTGQLFGMVIGSPFLPTTTQREELEDLDKDFDKHSTELETLLKKTVPAIEKQLNDAGVPRISIK